MESLRKRSVEKHTEEAEEEMARITLELPASLLTKIDDAKDQMGFRSRATIVTQLLTEIFAAPKETEQEGDKSKKPGPAST